jgi:hypothetical protein
MAMKKWYYSILLGVSSVASAALPPFYQSQREYVDLIHSGSLEEKLGRFRPIDSISTNKRGYLIKTGNCTLQVDRTYIPLPDGMTGPRQHKFTFNEDLKCEEGRGS